MKALVAGALVVALLLWGALWLTSKESLQPGGSPLALPAKPAQQTPAVAAPGVVSNIAGPAATPQTPPQPTVAGPQPPVPQVQEMGQAGVPGFKPKTEPDPPPPPPPIKPNEKGVIDLSNDPQTKAFGDALREGYEKRLRDQAQQRAPAPGGN